MRKQSLNFDNLGEVLIAARNGSKLGQQQFETPFGIAQALMLPLPAIRPAICDLECGHGALLAAACNESTEHLLGIDIDPTASASPKIAKRKVGQNVIVGDLNRIAPLLREAGFQSDLLVLNPPFSLQWPDGDSTLVTWRLAQEFLTARGEGMLICNDSTARRLIAQTPEASRIWLWVTLPNFFAGTRSNMRIAVLYFARDHRPEPEEHWIEVAMPSALPGAITEALGQFAVSRRRHIRGQTVRSKWDAWARSAETWKIVAQEWKRIRDEEMGKRQGWNIQLRADGRIETWLTPFQQVSSQVSRALAEELHSLDGQHPSALVVQKTSRVALQRAVSGGIWRVHPAVGAAVEASVRDYHANRAPFTRLNDVQRLGYLDEEDMIVCRAALDGFSPGVSYPLATETFEGKKTELRARPGHNEELVLVTGQELAILVTDDEGWRHCFTQYPPTNEDLRPDAQFHHLLPDLVAHFAIPDVPDVAAANPAQFQIYRQRLDALETLS